MVEKDPIEILKNQLNKVDTLSGLHFEHDLFRAWQGETKKVLEEVFTNKSIHTQNFLALKFREISIKGFSSPEIDRINSVRFKKDLENARKILQSAIKELTIDRTIFKKIQTKPKTVELSIKGEYFISSGIKDSELTKAITSAYDDSGLSPIYGVDSYKEDPIYKYDLIKKGLFFIYDISAINDKDSFLEFGIAIGLGKEIILISRGNSPIPEWVKSFKFIQYETPSELTEKLKNMDRP